MTFFASKSDPLGSKSDPLGSKSDPLDSKSDPLGAKSVPLASKSEPLLSADLSLKGTRRVGKYYPNLPNPFVSQPDFSPGLPCQTFNPLLRPASELASLFGEVFKGLWDEF